MKRREAHQNSVSALPIWILGVVLGCCGLGLASAAAQTAHLLADLAPEPEPAGSSPARLTVLGDRLIFAARDEPHGEEVWVTDGTPQGTRLLADLCPGACDSAPQSFAELAGGLLVAGYSGEIGAALWRVDLATGAVQLLLDPAFGSLRGGVASLTRLGDRVIFAAGGDLEGVELWRTDGTVAGTGLVRDICPGSCPGFPSHFALLGDRLLFQAASPGKGPELWITDGTTLGTFEVKDLCDTCSAFPVPLGVFDGKLYFTAQGENGFELFATDGTAAGTKELLDILPGVQSSEPIEAHRAGGEVLILARNCADGRGCLVKSGGSPVTTRRVADFLPPDPEPSICSLTTLASGVLLLTSTTSCTLVEPRQLWMTTPSLTSPRLLAAFHGFPRFLGSDGSRAYLLADAGDTGAELWVTDGTAAGTRLVKDILPGLDGSFPDEVAFFEGRLVFSAQGEIFDRELWESDGTPQGTRELAELRPDLGSSRPHSFTRAGSRVIFKASPRGASGLNLSVYSSDGTASGILLPDSAFTEAVSAGPNAFLAATAEGGGNRLFESEGTSTGTVLVAETAARAQFLAPLSRELFFGEQSRGQKLWQADASLGKRLVIDVNPSWTNEDPFFPDPKWTPVPPRPAQFPQSLTPAGDRLFFVAREDGAEDQLWVTDGSFAGTRMVREFPSASLPALTDRFNLTALGTKVIFTALTNTAGVEPWVSDGTPAGTFQLKDVLPGSASSDPVGLAAVAGRVTFFVTRADGPHELWATDGTSGGTVLIRALAAGGELARYTGQRVVSAGKLFFVAETPALGAELWVSDGTAAGTGLVKDLRPGPQGAGIRDLAAIGEVVGFAADDGISGHELWRSDGTAAGTSLVEDLVPGRLASSPAGLTAAGERVFFSAFDPEHGVEPFVISASAFERTCVPSADTLCLGGGRFAASARWRNPRTGAAGVAGAIPYGEGSGFFWFFRPENRELLLKVLDGRGVNGHFWVFGGATSDVEYTVAVRDLETGEVFEHRNPAGTFCGFAETRALPAPAGPALESAASTVKGLPPPPSMNLLGGRFRLTAEWVNPRTGAGGVATPVELSDQSTAFWFFRPENLELLVKMVDGRSVNGKFWFFYGAVSSLDYRLHVTDTVTGSMKTYESRAGEVCGRADVGAF